MCCVRCSWLIEIVVILEVNDDRIHGFRTAALRAIRELEQYTFHSSPTNPLRGHPWIIVLQFGADLSNLRFLRRMTLDKAIEDLLGLFLPSSSPKT